MKNAGYIASGILSLLGLVGLVAIIFVNVSSMYDTIGEGLQHRTAMSVITSLVPIPLMAGIGVLLAYLKHRSIQRVAKSLQWVGIVQIVFFTAVPLSLVLLEGELNGLVIIISVLCISFTAVFTLFFNRVYNDITNSQNPVA